MHDNTPIRQKPSDRVRGGSAALDVSYNEQAGAFKTLSHIVGELTPLGDALAGALNCTKTGALVALFAVGGISYVSTGPTNAVVAPTDGSTGVALRADDYTIIAMGEAKKWFVAGGGSATSVWAYLVEDFSEYIPKK